MRLRLLWVAWTTRADLGLRLSCWNRTTHAPTLEPEDPVHVVERRFQVFKDGLMLTLKLLDMRIVLPLSGADLLRNQIGAVLQIATDVTHLMIPPTFNLCAQTTKPQSSSG